MSIYNIILTNEKSQYITYDMKIGIFIIHSKEYTSRRKYVDNLLNFFNRPNIIVEIIDGVITDQILGDARFIKRKSLKKGQIGCALAHVSAYKRAIELNLDFVFIFEDDVEIKVDTYEKLLIWLNKLPNTTDICLLTNSGWHVGRGNDGRIHRIKQNDDTIYITCPFGTISYCMKKDILELLYRTQTKHIENNKIFIADGLFIHCKKDNNRFLNMVSPRDRNLLFKHDDNCMSIIGTVNNI